MRINGVLFLDVHTAFVTAQNKVTRYNLTTLIFPIYVYVAWGQESLGGFAFPVISACMSKTCRYLPATFVIRFLILILSALRLGKPVSLARIRTGLCTTEGFSALQPAHSSDGRIPVPYLTVCCHHAHKIQVTNINCLHVATNAPWSCGNEQIHQDLKKKHLSPSSLGQ